MTFFRFALSYRAGVSQIIMVAVRWQLLHNACRAGEQEENESATGTRVGGHGESFRAQARHALVARMRKDYAICVNAV